MKHFFLIVFCLLVCAQFVGAQAASKNTQPLAAGATAPDFSLSDAEGNKLTLSALKQPTVIVFYRGYW